MRCSSPARSAINANLPPSRLPDETMFLVHDAFAGAPVPKRKISAYHSAKMRKMCDALVSSENSTEQFKKRVQDYEHDRWHWDWRNQQDNGATRKKHTERQQNSEDRAGCADGRINSRRRHQ